MSFLRELFERRRKAIVITLIAIPTIILISVLVSTKSKDTSSEVPKVTKPVPDSEGEFEASSNKGPEGKGWGEIGNSDSILGSYAEAAISADGVPCATIAKEVLLEGGSAADASIAGLFCVGVVNSQSMGLGGGFLMTYYDRATKKAYTLDARETAPGAATETMYQGNATLSRRGGLAIAVPGELRGYYSFYLKFGGRVSWQRLLEPTIKLCEEGHPVNWHMARALRIFSAEFKREPTMSDFINPETGEVYQRGDLIKRPTLALTLRAIQNNPDDLYSGATADLLLQDLKKMGSIITKEDLLSYRPEWREPTSVSLRSNLRLHSIPPPGSGALLAALVNIMDEVGVEGDETKVYGQFAEALKYVYARRPEMGDLDNGEMEKFVSDLSSEDYSVRMASLLNVTLTSNDPLHYTPVGAIPPDDHGTAHFSLVSPDGDAVSVTSTVNLYFGSGLVSTQTGIVLNDEMDDFSSPNVVNYFGVPPSKANFIKPGKRPLSSMAPAIIVDESSGDVRLVLGAAGGTKIPSGLTNVILLNLWRGKNIKEAIDARRIHHQLYPMTLMYEKGLEQDIVASLQSKGHTVKEFSVGGSVVCAIEKTNNRLLANSDFRKSGQVDGF